MPITVAAIDPAQGKAADFLAAGPKDLLIDGRWVPAAGGATFATTDPATGRELAQVARAMPEDAEAAVAAARRALKDGPWAGITPAEKGKLLWRIADLIEEHAEELAELETLDQGKAYGTARFGEIPAAAAQFRYYSGMVNQLLGTTIPTSITRQGPGRRIFAYTTREPVGVVAAIVPWNSPLLMAAMKLAPALAAGCTVVLKPAENTPLTALRLGGLLVEAGVPAGVVNILTGFGGEVGSALSTHRGVDKVAFTGSTAVGKQLVSDARGNLKRLTLELGGKSPAIVLPDADLATAVPGVARGIFDNGGQVCVAGSRIYAHRDIYRDVVDGLAEYGAGLTLGHGLDPATDLGPLVSRVQAERVDSFIQGGRAEGVRVVTGGSTGGSEGTFYSPTVLTGVGPDSRIMREEIFGPVAVVTPYDDLDEVLTWANDSPYGLASSIWTESLSHAHRLAADLNAGTVWINCHSYFSPELPKGGHKESGWGYENGAPGLENYLESKTVCAVI
jgi:phenylacetaldehyde dehydrogenase